MVAYTGVTVKTASFILQDAYHSLRLWALSSDSITAIGSLNLDRVLGNAYNATEVCKFCDVIRVTDFSVLPPSQRARGSTNYPSLSPGRQGQGADWVYYDPWYNRGQGAKCTYEHARTEMGKVRHVPDGHPVGWDFTAIPNGWVPSEAVDEQGNPVEGWRGDGLDNTVANNPDVGSDDTLEANAEDSLQSMRRVLRRIGGIPDVIVHGTEDMIVGFLQGRLYSQGN